MLASYIRNADPSKKGFTLIELLVVIAIIALLVSILLPSLTMAKNLAKKVACGCNLKQMGTAFAFYLEDNSTYYPPLNNVSNNPNQQWWTNLLIDGGYVDSKYSELYGGADWGKVTDGIFNCPSVTEDMYRSGYPAYGINVSHTRATTMLFGYGFSVRASDVIRNSELILLSDACWSSSKMTSCMFSCSMCGSWLTIQVSSRHVSDTSNILFFDNHVSSVTQDMLLDNENDMFAHTSR